MRKSVSAYTLLCCLPTLPPSTHHTDLGLEGKPRRISDATIVMVHMHFHPARM